MSSFEHTSATTSELLAEGRSPEAALAAFTVGRLLLVPCFVGSFLVSPIFTTVTLGLFVLADIYDGVIARHYDADGPFRRALDSTVDRVGIDAFVIAACVAGALPLPLAIALLARDLYCGILCAVMLRARRVAIKADTRYKALNLSIAFWAVAAPFVSQETRNVLAIGILVAALFVALDLTRLVFRVMSASQSLQACVLHAQRVRANALP